MDIELTKAVAALRDELLEAAQAGDGQQLTFVVGPVEMEFAIELRADVKAKAGFKAWVVNTEVSGGVNRGSTHKVKVTLTPKGADGGDLLISTRDAAPIAPVPDSHLGR
ncbi:trypco2 family protein [Actinoplanes aureus]|uniref:Trypsin-co-occurring domain-containing protein n=1 Tax=Actinoplanes aureus TaxID=2792083 RepID=A0A931CKC5_9ACTN|nr:trypco2 family protein [Actinoplanes aureus]MBG0567813.1 hypothetical protein [Actinoplanes aureus]